MSWEELLVGVVTAMVFIPINCWIYGRINKKKWQAEVEECVKKQMIEAEEAKLNTKFLTHNLGTNINKHL